MGSRKSKNKTQIQRKVEGKNISFQARTNKTQQNKIPNKM